MDCTVGLELCFGQTMMTVHCEGSYAEQVMFAGKHWSEFGSSSWHLCYQPLCAAPPPLTRGETAWHFLWVVMPHQLISSLLSFLIFCVYPWSLSLFCCLIFWLLIFPPCSACLSVSPSLLWGQRRSGVKKKEYAVAMATASRSWASTLPQTCPSSLVLPLLALLRLKLTSDENEEKKKEAGGTRDRAVLVREE